MIVQWLELAFLKVVVKVVRTQEEGTVCRTSGTRGAINRNGRPYAHIYCFGGCGKKRTVREQLKNR